MKKYSLAGKITAVLLIILFAAGCGPKEMDKEKFYTEVQRELQKFLEQSKTLIQDVEKEFENLTTEYVNQYQEEYPQIDAEGFRNIQKNLEEEKNRVIKNLQELIDSIESKDLPDDRDEVISLIQKLNQEGYNANSQWVSVSSGVRKSLQKLLSDNGFNVRIF